MPSVPQSKCSRIICQLIGGCQAHLARQLISPWKEEPLGVCWLTGKVLTLGTRQGKPEQALARNPHTVSLVFLNPILRREEVRGFKDTWNLSLWQIHVATSGGCSGLVLGVGCPPTPAPRRHPALFLQREGELGEPCTLVFPELQTRSPEPSGDSRWPPRCCAGVPALPATPTRGSPSLPPSCPAGRSAHTRAPARGRAGGGGCCCRCRCRSPSPSRRDCPPCCRLCGRLSLSLWPKPRRASRRSSRGEEDTARRRGAAGWGELGSEQGAPAAGRRLPGSPAQSLLQPLPEVPGSAMPLRSF